MSQLIWNDLSIVRHREHPPTPIAADVAAARSYMESFTAILQAWLAKKLPPRLVLTNEMEASPLAPGYLLPQWRADREVNRDSRQLFSIFATKSSAAVGLGIFTTVPSGMAELRVDNVSSIALLLAHLNGYLAVSWPSDVSWNEPLLRVIVSELDEDVALQVQEISIPHASCSAHIDQYFDQLNIDRIKSLTSGNKILESANIFLPQLIFVGQALKTLSSWDPSEKGWNWMIRTLCSLNDVCTKWQTSTFPHDQINTKCSPESIGVWNNPTLRASRTFIFEDGQPRYCEWHAKQMGQNLRLHYSPDNDLRRVRVAYIGDHLPLP